MSGLRAMGGAGCVLMDLPMAKHLFDGGSDICPADAFGESANHLVSEPGFFFA